MGWSLRRWPAGVLAAALLGWTLRGKGRGFEGLVPWRVVSMTSPI